MSAIPRINAPAFQFYPNDFLGSGKIAAMTLEEVGVYTLLLCFDWNEGGLPDDTRTLARWVRLPERRFAAIWATLRDNFSLREGRWYNERLDRERDKQATRRTKLAAAANARWHPPTDANAHASDDTSGDANAYAPASAMQCLSSSSSSSTAVRTNNKLRTTSADAALSAGPEPQDDAPTTPTRAARKEPRYPHYPTPVCQALHAAWLRVMEQHVEYALFRRETAKAFTSPATLAEHPPDRIEEALSLYAMLRDQASERERAFYTPAKWAADLPRLLRIIAQPMSAPDGTLTEKARIVLGGL